MYGNSLDGMFAALIFFGVVIGGAICAAGWAFYSYIWPWLKGWLHAVWAIGELQRELMKTLERPGGGDVGIKG